MVTVVRLFGIAIVAFAVAILISPDLMKKWIGIWGEAKKVYLAVIINFLFGVILLLAARQCSVPEFVIFAAILGLIKGITLVILGPKRLKLIIEWGKTRKPAVVRIIAFLLLTFGTLLVCSA